MSTAMSASNVVALMGRLGNQLFQYSFARWLEEETGLPSRFDLSGVRRVGLPESPGLAGALKQRSLRTSRYWPTVIGSQRSLALAMRRRVGPHGVVIDLSGAGQSAGIGSSPAWWVGYWQQRRFAQPFRQEISALLGVSLGAQPADQPRLGVHVRRGDYVGLGLQKGQDWYGRAVEVALEGTSGYQVEVYSDDPRWCREHLKLPTPFVIKSEGHPTTDFLSLATAQRLVISRSTYSWWAAFIAGVPVVLPASEGADDWESGGLILDDWTSL